MIRRCLHYHEGEVLGCWLDLDENIIKLASYENNIFFIFFWFFMMQFDIKKITYSLCSVLT
jgi:hypothetical protein